MTGKHDLDSDRFGYLDLEDEVEKLGFVSWSCLVYKVPQTMSYKILRDDKDVIQMLSHLSMKMQMGKLEVIQLEVRIMMTGIQRIVNTRIQRKMMTTFHLWMIIMIN